MVITGMAIGMGVGMAITGATTVGGVMATITIGEAIIPISAITATLILMITTILLITITTHMGGKFNDRRDTA